MPSALLAAPPPVSDGFDLMDDPQVWADFSQPLPQASGMAQGWTSRVAIKGMFCAACALTVEEALQAVPGVVRASASAASHRAQVVWSAARVKPSVWMRALTVAGYRVVPVSDAGAGERRRLESRQALWRWGVAGFCMMQVMMYAYPAYVAAPGDLAPEMAQLLRWASWVLSLPVLFFSCAPFWRGALRDIRRRRVGMDLPVALGMLITFAVSTAGTFEPDGALGGEVYFDSFTMFVFFLLSGRWLELRLRDRTAGALEALVNRLPDSVERLGKGEGAHFERVIVRQLLPGDVIRVLPGQAFAADGVVLQGDTMVDEALLTGESWPLARGPGAAVMAGSHNLTAGVLVRVERIGSRTRFAQMVTLMDSAAASKPQVAQLADRLARPFLLAVLVAAALAAMTGWAHGPVHALMVAVAVLIVTCPCALSLATPTAMLAAAGTLARRGLLVRRLQALEALATIDTVVFDKTGTLTRDAVVIGAIHTRAGVPQQQALAMAAALAGQSLHPVSRALAGAAERAGSQHDWMADGVAEFAGQGVSGRVACTGDTPDVLGVPTSLRLGSARFCGVVPQRGEVQTVHLSDASGWLASFDWQEALRPDAAAAIAALWADGIDVRVLSGDHQAAVTRVAAQLGIGQARGDCTPDDKLAVLRELQQQGRQVAMVGDGLNDGPVLAGAQVSIAFGQAVPLTQARADVVVVGDRLMQVVDVMRLARRTLRVVRQNLGWAVGYNAVCVPMAMLGWLPAWLAGLGMALSSCLVVLNALRLAANPSPATRLEPTLKTDVATHMEVAV